MSPMSLSVLLEGCKGLSINEQRYNSEDYKELVFYLADLSRWQEAFELRLGPAAKPAGVEPSAEQLRLTKNYGGIRSHQTLFVGQADGRHIQVMFWPWADKEHVTLKMAVYT